MKSILGVLAGLLLLVSTTSAQTQDEAAKEKFQKNYEAKLKKDFISKVSWEKSFEAAKSKANAENKLMLGYFTRSYAP
jgi:hypothetical protein